MLTLKKNFLKEYGIAVVAYTGTEKDVKQVIKARDEEKRMAVQKLEEYALNREALKGLRSKLKRLADAGKPAVASVASYDAAATSTTPYHPSMMNIAEECQRILLKIADRQAEILIIEDALQIINKGINCEHYGDILFMLGEVDEAVTYWQKALEAGSESAELLQKKIKNKKYIEK